MPRSSDRVARSHGVAGRVRDWAAAGSTAAGVSIWQDIMCKRIIYSCMIDSIFNHVANTRRMMRGRNVEGGGRHHRRRRRVAGRQAGKFDRAQRVLLSGTTNKKDEETAVSSATEETTVVLGMRTRTGNDPGEGIDLLAALQLHNTTRPGVTQVPGLVRLKPAYYLQGE
ncbi:hypothetical protein X777_00942 [Ooceraea biroi]|uniref:Uncharacterized protein n=1 Tax=Ooceraea biroi TaxID=2015173 RepID=A0A026WP96_OOCBI|nr:hypothetical protein X777_00942 [Ooceraea biroi]